MKEKDLVLLEHPLIHHYLSILRNKKTNHVDFRKALHEITRLTIFFVTKNFATKKINIETPLKKTQGYKIDEEIILIPILRAGLGMVDAYLKVFPDSKIVHMGYYRDKKTYQPKNYYLKIPPLTFKSKIIILEPMIATGNTIVAALKELRKHTQNKIQIVSLFAVPEGIEKIRKSDVNVQIFLTQKDEGLNKNKYIIPGIGDAGDRFFNSN